MTFIRKEPVSVSRKAQRLSDAVLLAPGGSESLDAMRPLLRYIARLESRSVRQHASNIIPGTIAKHAIVTDTCRRNKGDYPAGDEAVTRLLNEYFECMDAWKDKGAQFHFVLTIERPRTIEG